MIRDGRAVYSVLGMHRSGTSWAAGSLEEKGLALGSVNEAARYNQKGTRENDELQAIHVAVLEDSGGSWRDPPRRIVWKDARRRALESFIADMTARYECWGFKDPRTLLLLDEWKRQVPELEFVGIFRHPSSVARSLAGREFSPVPTRQGLRLWRTYNSRLVDEHQRHGFPLLRFDGNPAQLFAGVGAVAKAWKLPNADKPNSFFDQELVHNAAAEDERVPTSCLRLWKYLVDHTTQYSASQGA